MPPQPRRILVLDPQADAAPLQGLVERIAGSAHHVRRLPDAAAALASAEWDVLVLELRLDEGSALDLLPALSRGRPLPPIVLVAADAGVQDITRALRGPVGDFVPRPCEPFALAAALERAWSPPPAIPAPTARATPLLQGAVRALGDLEAAKETPAGAAERLDRSPRLLAARLVAEQRWGPRPVGPRTSDRASSDLLSAGLLATAWSLEGPWRVAAAERAEAGVQLSRDCRETAQRVGIDPDTAELAALLRATTPVALMVAAAASPACRAPEAALLARIEEKATQVSRSLLPQWGLPPGAAARLGLHDVGDPTAPKGIASLLAWTAARGDEADGPTGPTKLEDLLAAVHRHRRAHWRLPIPRDFDARVVVQYDHIAIPVTLRELASRRAQVTLETVEREVVHTIVDRARLDGVWLDMRDRTGRFQARVPVELSKVRSAPPFHAELRMVGAPHHEERLRAVALQAVNRRSTVRLPADTRDPVRARVLVPDADAVLEAALMDVSMSGLALLTHPQPGRPLAPGRAVRLELALHDALEPLPLSGRVTHVRAVDGTDPASGAPLRGSIAGISLDPLSFTRHGVRRRWTAMVMDRQRAVLRGIDRRRR